MGPHALGFTATVWFKMMDTLRDTQPQNENFVISHLPSCRSRHSAILEIIPWKLNAYTLLYQPGQCGYLMERPQIANSRFPIDTVY